MGKYFDKFPAINYGGKLAKNIMSRVDFSDKTKADINTKFEYALSGSYTRPDLLSDAAYGSSYYDWVVYIANGVIDPYYDYLQSDSDFAKYIKGKYGSYKEAEEIILYFKNNWGPDDSTLTDQMYDNLPPKIKKYYQPKLNNANVVIGYSRKHEDWIVSTNMIMDFIVDDITKYEGMKRIYQGELNQATIIGIDPELSKIRVQHVIGNFEVDQDILEIELIQRVIAEDEWPYWVPVSAYDKELEDNNKLNTINLIKSEYIQGIEKAFNEQIKL